MIAEYKIRDAQSLKFQTLDYISLLYDRLSGITHVVTDPAPQIIQVLGQNYLSSKQVETILQRQFDMTADENDNSFEDIITARLDEFVELGLVEKKFTNMKSNENILAKKDISL